MSPQWVCEQFVLGGMIKIRENLRRFKSRYPHIQLHLLWRFELTEDDWRLIGYAAVLTQ